MSARHLNYGGALSMVCLVYLCFVLNNWAFNFQTVISEAMSQLHSALSCSSLPHWRFSVITYWHWLSYCLGWLYTCLFFCFLHYNSWTI